MKAKPDRKKRGVRRPPKPATKPLRGLKAQTVGSVRPSPIELSGGVEDEEALVTAESLDEREKEADYCACFKLAGAAVHGSGAAADGPTNRRRPSAAQRDKARSPWQDRHVETVCQGRRALRAGWQ